jgi:Uma2 family endonuclease
MQSESQTALLEHSAAPPKRPKISFEDFLVQTSDGTFAEWVDGEVIAMTVTNEHQELVFFLVALLRHFAEAHKLGRVFGEPFVMKTGAGLPGRAPDVFFVTKDNLTQLRKHHFDGAADLVVEIVSPDSRGRGRGDKYYEYEQGGVREYWLIDPLRKRADFYQLGEEGIYRTVGADETGVYRSRVMEGLWIKVDWLWQEPLPELLSVLKEWKLI